MDQLHILKTEEDYDTALNELLELAKGGIDENNVDRYELLSLLVENYDDKHVSIPEADPIQAIRFIMEQSGLKAPDMRGVFGTTSRFYEVMNGKRSLTLNMIRKLHDMFGISADILIRNTAIA
jgi:HTH-type transcriptional regulator/antitoxin HigA